MSARWMILFFLSLAPAFAWAQGAEDDLSSNRMSLDNVWGVSYFAATNWTTPQFEGTRNAVDVYNYLSFSRSLGRDQRLAIRPSWNMNSAGVNKYGDSLQAGSRLNDLQINYSNYDFGEIMDIPVSGALKVYLPTSRYSQDARMIARTAGDLFFEFYDFRRVTLSYAFKPGYTWNNESAYFDKNAPRYPDGAFKTSPIKATRAWTLDQYMNLDWRPTSKYKFGASVGVNEDWTNSSIKESIPASHTTFLTGGLSAEWRPRRGMSFSTSYSTRTWAGGGKFNFGRPQDSQVGLSTSIYLN